MLDMRLHVARAIAWRVVKTLGAEFPDVEWSEIYDGYWEDDGQPVQKVRAYNVSAKLYEAFNDRKWELDPKHVLTIDMTQERKPVEESDETN